MESNRITLTWDDVDRLIDERLPKHKKVYGIPRNGTIVALRMPGSQHVSSPDQADILIDDVRMTGKTVDTWSRMFKLPVAVLIDKTRDPAFKGKWIQFPWEIGGKDERETIVRMLEMIGEDPTRDGLRQTPDRVVRAWGELYGGYRQDPVKILGTRFEKGSYDQMVTLRAIPFSSMCEHHILPIIGEVHIAYIPSDKVVGISKLIRLVDVFARRLQIQERLTQQICDALEAALQPKGIGVVVKAEHFCMRIRGVNRVGATMITSSIKGAFNKLETREEWLRMIDVGQKI